nr:retrovirus-related Pol polyprotein from transposon TNT 1-94 [Tanacetum cinerariifolium]
MMSDRRDATLAPSAAESSIVFRYPSWLGDESLCAQLNDELKKVDEKLDATKRKLHEHYQQAENAGPKPADMTDAEYNAQDEKAHSTILLLLSDEVLYEVADEETAAGVRKKIE